jgi:hypothetical protein
MLTQARPELEDTQVLTGAISHWDVHPKINININININTGLAPAHSQTHIPQYNYTMHV